MELVEPQPPMCILAMAGLAAHIVTDKFHDIVMVSGNHHHGNGAPTVHKTQLLIPNCVRLTWKDGLDHWKDGKKRVTPGEGVLTLDPRGLLLTLRAEGAPDLAVQRLPPDQRLNERPASTNNLAEWQSIDWLLPLNALYPTGQLRSADSWTGVGGVIRVEHGDVVCEGATRDSLQTFKYEFQPPGETSARAKFVPEWVVNRFPLREPSLVIAFSELADPKSVIAELTLTQTEGNVLAFAAVNVSEIDTSANDMTEHVDLYRSSLFDHASENPVAITAKEPISVSASSQTPYRRALEDLFTLVAPVFPGPPRLQDTPHVGCPRAAFFAS